MLSSCLEKNGPKHSTSVPFSLGVAVPLSVDKNEVAFVPNPVPGVTMKGLPVPQGTGSLAVLCSRVHSSVPPTLQMVIPFMSPILHQNVNVLPGQAGAAPVNCPATQPGGECVTVLPYDVE